MLAVAVSCTASNEGIHGAAVGLQPHVGHDAEHAQGARGLPHMQQGAHQGVEGRPLHVPMLAG